MDEQAFYLIQFFVLFGLIQSLILAQRKEVFILILVTLLVTYKLWLTYNESKKHKSNNANVWDDLAKEGVARHSDPFESNANPKTDRVLVAKAKMLMSVDTLLQRSLTDLGKFKELNLQAYNEVIRMLFGYYKLYSQVLVGKKNVRENFPNLIDMRRSILNELTTFFMQVTSEKCNKEIYAILLQVQASTHKCLNVLKNKYDVIDAVPPLPANVMEDSRSLF